MNRAIRCLAGATYEAPRATRKAAAARFTARPEAVAAGGKVKITFAVSAETDVELAVVDAKGRVVRHLAAGLLGAHAPAPLNKGTLRQEVLWDGRDDLGKPAWPHAGGLRARVRIGTAARLEKVLGWDGLTLGDSVVGLTVGRGGEVFVLLSDAWYGRASLRVLDRQGRYLRTIVPYPAETPAERTAPIGQIKDGRARLPIVFNGHAGNTLPLTAGLKHQTMAFTPAGNLLLVSAVGTMAEHGPPRHLLALHPAGGAPPEMGFVGPMIRPAKGFLGGAGEGGTRYFDHLAVSGDGKWIYFVPCNLRARRPRHAVFRLRWTDEKLGKCFLGTDGQAGDDEKHFNDPQGVATDSDGRIYVCDRGNNRVAVFSADGKRLGQFAADAPEQIAVHRKTGAIYVLSRSRSRQRQDRWAATAVLRKFGRFGGGQAKEQARMPAQRINLMALDGEADPPKLWCLLRVRGGTGQRLLPVTDQGGALEAGKPVGNDDGLDYPMFLAADPARNRVILRERRGRTRALYAVDLKSGRSRLLNVRGADVALDRDGNLYVMDGYGTNSLSRYSPDGKPLPLAGVGSHRIATGVYRGYGPDLGLRGHCVDLKGNIYLIRSSNYGGPGALGSRVDVFGPDGKPKRRNLIDGLGYGDCGLGVDAAGNVYVGANVKPAGRPFPEPFAGQVPAKGWLWWRGAKRALPWRYPYCNAYLFHWGSVLKFGPSGGALYGHPYERKLPAGAVKPDVFSAEKAPAGAVSYRSAYLGREIKVVGAAWRFSGYGIVPGSSDGPRPDPGCVCWTSRLAVDGFGRVFAPNVFRFGVEVLDTNGNRLLRVGRYGNCDRPRGPAGETIAFAWPAFVSLAEGKMYVSDSANRRVTVVGFEWAGSADCALPAERASGVARTAKEGLR